MRVNHEEHGDSGQFVALLCMSLLPGDAEGVSPSDGLSVLQHVNLSEKLLARLQ